MPRIALKCDLCHGDRCFDRALVEDEDLGVKEDARGALLKVGDPRGLQLIEELSLKELSKPLILGVTGASGLIYAVRTLKYLLLADYTIDLVASKSAYTVWQAEDQTRMPPEPSCKNNFGAANAG